MKGTLLKIVLLFLLNTCGPAALAEDLTSASKEEPSHDQFGLAHGYSLARSARRLGDRLCGCLHRLGRHSLGFPSVQGVLAGGAAGRRGQPLRAAQDPRQVSLRRRHVRHLAPVILQSLPRRSTSRRCLLSGPERSVQPDGRRHGFHADLYSGGREQPGAGGDHHWEASTTSAWVPSSACWAS